MREFMDYVHSAFYEATGWRRDNSYAALNSTSDGNFHHSLPPFTWLSLDTLLIPILALLNFNTPRGLRLTLSALASPNFATSYQLGSVGVVDGSISYLFSSVPLRVLLTPQSENVPLPDLLRSYRPLTPVARRDDPSLRRPDDNDKTHESLLYGRLYLPRSQLEALLVRRLSPALQAQFSAVSGQHLRDGGTALGLVQYDVGRYALEGLASTDGGLLGFRGVYNFGGDLSNKKHASPSAASGAENGNYHGSGNGDKERIYGRFSTGGEIYYGTLNKSGGISIGARFATLPDHKGTPLSATLTMNPLMGNIAASYAVMAGKDCSLATRMEFNIFSYESSWAVGMELWRKPFARTVVESEPTADDAAKVKTAMQRPSPNSKTPAIQPNGKATPPKSMADAVPVPTSAPAERSFNAKLEWRLDEPEKQAEKKTGPKASENNASTRSKGSKTSLPKLGQPVKKVDKEDREDEEKELHGSPVTEAATCVLAVPNPKVALQPRVALLQLLDPRNPLRPRWAAAWSRCQWSCWSGWVAGGSESEPLGALVSRVFAAAAGYGRCAGSSRQLLRPEIACESLLGTGFRRGNKTVAEQPDCGLKDSLAPPSVTFRTRSIRTITKPSFFVQHPGTAASPAATEEVRVIKCICLPLREESHILLGKFIDDVIHFHHIFHTPSLLPLVDQFYDALDQDADVDIGQLMLMLAICCSSTHTWTRCDDGKGLFDTAEDANSRTAGWLATALDAIHHAHRAAHASMACIQGIVVVFFMLCSLEGISARARLLHAQAVAMAREIGLHSIDSPNTNSQSNPIKDSTIQAEVGRRIWWYLTDSDWMLSRLSVPQQGAYTILPSQMAVRKPYNAKDEDIIDGQEIIDRPLEEATPVSYLIQRTRLAELFFSLGDHDKSIHLVPEEAEYLKVMEADMKLRQFMRELPSFFRLENSSALSKLPYSDIRRSSNITTQRYLLNMIFYGQICKLHLPYLARGTVNPGFAYSHDSCLKAAQRIIFVEHQMGADNSTFVQFRKRMNIKFRSIFIACVVFVLDGCLANNIEADTVGSNATMADAWQILYEARGQSPMASELLRLSIQILRKYKATHPALEMIKRENCTGETAPLEKDGAMDIELAESNGKLNDSETERTEGEMDNGDLDKLWQTIHGRGREWNNVFWGFAPPLM
ncbi:fungal transcriptional regulatory protein [Trichoderma arundinaceum]|uniref:Mitochondrial distribution and morphology protein 10 n=1 Tax=Trichoderma arundinaceum TaxID=490622 RepID=A0A395P161_TRIAR|nr:fungal transcriptional regulatory protein [Trichoderma arundinaceum]